ncbi:MAG TPA: TonB family protein [Steroidobacteraceae bacterium]
MTPSRSAAALWQLLAVLALCGCAAQPRTVAVRVLPVDVTTTYIEAYVHHFARGQFAIVSVCIAPDGAIAAVRVVESSTDKAFDDAALVWARQAHYRPQLENGQPVYGCREVRVEINSDPSPRLSRGADSALG